MHRRTTTAVALSKLTGLTIQAGITDEKAPQRQDRKESLEVSKARIQ